MSTLLFNSLIVEENGVKIAPGAGMQLRSNAGTARAATAVDFLLPTALDLFCGHAPAASPYLPDGDLITLPWADEYHVQYADSNRLHRRITPEELEHFAAELCIDWPDRTPMQLATLNSKTLCISNRFIVQGFAVEILLDLDRYLSALCQLCWHEAIDWFATANSNLIEAISEARPLAVDVVL